MPKHRAPARHRAPRTSPGKALRTSLTLSTMAVVGTGLAVSGGAALGGAAGPEADDAGLTAATVTTPRGAESADDARVDTAALESRTDTTVVSRSDRREETDPLKADLLAVGEAPDNALTRTEDLSDEDPRTIARALLAEFGFAEDQFGCLDSLWEKESHWNVYADNPTSSAYGIPQALPGSKMSSAGPDWETNPVTQIRWGLGYIQDRYGSPCSAWGHSQSHNWY